MSRLTTFVAPQPDVALMRRLVPVNRWLNLHGLPLLRDLPWFGRLPGFSGLTDIRRWHVSAEDEARLRQTVRPEHVCFIGPNHPEFFTDWMIDKELSARFAPRMASWATHTVVNGMGARMQRFWLRNNLIAQIPGEGGQHAKRHSVDWARQGHAVLLHPEGAVGWHADWIAPLFTGIAELAMAAYREEQASGGGKPVYIQPVLWKLRFCRDAERAVRKELLWTARRLNLSVTQDAALPEQWFELQSGVLEREADKLGLPVPSRRQHSYFARRESLMRGIAARLDALCPQMDAALPLPRRWSRALRESGQESLALAGKPLLAAWERLTRIPPEAYDKPLIALEHIAESVKRVRQDYCKGRLRDTLNAFIPRPAAARDLYLRVPAPVDIGQWLAEGHAAEPAGLAEHLRGLMQAELDALLSRLHAEQPYWRLSNPLYSQT
ncbi:hypothetical protein [uncultured Aquitalea sp.]|uniref:hypothetical protein n=1 Tax=uncultured Aquitalea sp. TaxID=540272 RepID=UPI0025FADD07|nr:hypothetical protein [uncultured Aquitalea sp.]